MERRIVRRMMGQEKLERRCGIVMEHRKQNVDVAKHRHRKWPTSMSSMDRNENIDVFLKNRCFQYFSREVDDF